MAVAYKRLKNPPGWSNEVSSRFIMDGLAFRVYGEIFVAESVPLPQFMNPRNQYNLGFGFSAGISNMPGLMLDMEYFFVSRDYDTQLSPPPFATTDNDTCIETQALLVGGRGVYPMDGPIRAYLAAECFQPVFVCYLFKLIFYELS